MLKLEELKVRKVYEVDARNFSVGVWTGEFFIGIRYKMGSTFLDREFHYDSDPHFGTVQPIKEIGEVPEGIELLLYVEVKEDGRDFLATYKPLFEFLQTFRKQHLQKDNMSEENVAKKYSAYQKCIMIRNYLCRKASEVIVYKNWSAEFSTENLREAEGIILKEIGTVNIAELTEEQMKELGFGKFSEGDPSYLIPLYLFPYLPEEIITRDLNGHVRVLKKSEMDNDHRCGLLAYGIFPGSIAEESNLNEEEKQK